MPSYEYDQNYSVFEKAKLRLQKCYFADWRLRDRVMGMLDALAAADLCTAHNYWLQLYELIAPEDLPDLLGTINESFAEKGVLLELSTMPGQSKNAESINCISISIMSMRRAILLPLDSSFSVGLCKLSAPFLGSNYWMEAIYNENPKIAFKQAVGILFGGAELSPPPLTMNFYQC
ncbi:MAG: hypothetical protein K2X27_20905 [Candidatus Obscuribacterales bacterium]|nr:hypothetical protein [Candidatus Obscuribacterales bacterium]